MIAIATIEIPLDIPDPTPILISEEWVADFSGHTLASTLFTFHQSTAAQARRSNET
jgi:hypothetical protein